MLAVLLIGIVVLALVTPHASAAETTAALPALLPAIEMTDIVHDRSRLIQFSLVAVCLGIALLWWGNSRLN